MDIFVDFSYYFATNFSSISVFISLFLFVIFLSINLFVILKNRISSATEVNHASSRVVYLDHAGSATISNACTQSFRNLPEVLRNPHSSIESVDAINRVRQIVLDWFNSSRDDYDIVFTSGATAALKLIGETFPFIAETSKLVYHIDLHTSALGIRSYASRCNAKIFPISNFNDLVLISESVTVSSSLLLLSLESNFSGSYPPDIEKYISLFKNYSECWFVCLDIAKACATNFIDISSRFSGVDFFTLSFYKIFGYPTGLGALIIRKTSSKILKKMYYGGGSLLAVSAISDFHVPRNIYPHQYLEDGTANYASILELPTVMKNFIHVNGVDFFNWRKSSELCMLRVYSHAMKCAHVLYNGLSLLKHYNGSCVVEVYGNWNNNVIYQGPIVCFNVFRANQTFVAYSIVALICDMEGVMVRTGCMCNPGACQLHLNLTSTEIEYNYENGKTCGDDLSIINGKPTGAIRASFGWSSLTSDGLSLVRLVEKYFVEKSESVSSYKHISLRNTILKVTEILVYPIKSCLPIRPAKWQLLHNGFLHDRRFAILELQTHSFLSLRRNHSLRFLQPHLDLFRNIMTLEWKSSKFSYINLSIFESDWLDFVVENPNILNRICDPILENRTIRYHPAASKCISSWLNMSCVFIGAPVDDSFVNEDQLLVVSNASVNDLCERVNFDNSSKLVLSSDLFRANIVVQGKNLQPYAEDGWKSLYFSRNIVANVSSPCARCSTINFESSNEPLKTLAAFRRQGSEINFGVLMRIDASSLSHEQDVYFLAVDDDVVAIPK